MTPNGMMVIGKYQLLQRFVVVDLSNFYFDTAKDRLYVGYACPHPPSLSVILEIFSSRFALDIFLFFL
jgi:isoleucyl-tRNA synthetase